jgi:hypothetical protein
MEKHSLLDLMNQAGRGEHVFVEDCVVSIPGPGLDTLPVPIGVEQPGSRFKRLEEGGVAGSIYLLNCIAEGDLSFRRGLYEYDVPSGSAFTYSDMRNCESDFRYAYEEIVKSVSETQCTYLIGGTVDGDVKLNGKRGDRKTARTLIARNCIWQSLFSMYATVEGPWHIVDCEFLGGFFGYVSEFQHGLALDSCKFQPDCRNWEYDFSLSGCEIFASAHYRSSFMLMDTSPVRPELAVTKFHNGAYLKGLKSENLVVKGCTLSGEFELPGEYWDKGFFTRLLSHNNSLSYERLYIADCTSTSFHRWIENEVYLNEFKGRHRYISLAWYLLSDYGRSWILWGIWCLAVALGLFPAIYGTASIFVDKLFSIPTVEWYDYFYFSVVTFSSLGFGDIAPVHWLGKAIAMLEILTGYGMLGGLIGIIAGRLIRRA